VRYEDLGAGILGLTKFGKKGVKEVIIAQYLDEQNSQSGERLIRSTIAHEAGHGLLPLTCLYCRVSARYSLTGRVQRQKFFAVVKENSTLESGGNTRQTAQ
jgi:hypothetical protein